MTTKLDRGRIKHQLYFDQKLVLMKAQIGAAAESTVTDTTNIEDAWTFLFCAMLLLTFCKYWLNPSCLGISLL